MIKIATTHILRLTLFLFVHFCADQVWCQTVNREPDSTYPTFQWSFGFGKIAPFKCGMFQPHFVTRDD